MCWWCLWWSARRCQGFHKESWWEWDRVHKTWQVRCWLFLRQIHQWQAPKLARDFQQKRCQGKHLDLEEENCFWWCRFFRCNNQKRHLGGHQSQMLKEEVFLPRMVLKFWKSWLQVVLDWILAEYYTIRLHVCVILKTRTFTECVGA